MALILRTVFVLIITVGQALVGRADVGEWSVCLPSGVPCTLTFRGEGVWRILSDKADPQGAIQSFAAFAGQPEPYVAKPFAAVRDEQGGMVATGADGSRVIIAADGSIDTFAAGADVPAVELRTAAVEGGHSAVGGRLDEGEEVYGLGERLDAVPKRGRRISLWSTDGYANRDETYLPVPFFLTTRGGGVFLNTYRRTVADFDVERKGFWSLVSDENCVDVYLVAGCDPAAALRAAVRLQGGTIPPPDWARGPVICRLAPDFCIWDGPGFSKRCGHQLIGTGIREILERHLSIGAKPTAFLLEGFRTLVFDRRERQRIQAREQLREVCSRLGGHGMRAMRYMRVGQVQEALDDPDFRPEYLLHADIYTNGVLAVSYADLIPDVPQPGKNPDVVGKQPAFRYLDITNPDAWKWYLEKVWAVYSDCGIRGAKIDFCELLPEERESYGGMHVCYHWHDPSVFARGAIHHAYAPFFVSKLAKAMSDHNPEDGFYAFTRGGGIGSGLYPAVWAGDQWRTDYVAADQLRAILNSSLSGIPFQSYDIAGYQYEEQKFTEIGAVDVKTRKVRLGANPRGCEESLFRREAKNMSVEEEAEIFLNSLYTAYTPNLQANGCVRHVYEFDEATIAAYRRVVGQMEALAGYKGKLAREAASTGLPPVRHLVLNYPKDRNVYGLDDEFMLGDALLVAPVFNMKMRTVYLPEGEWLSVDSKERLKVGKEGLRVPVKPVRGIVPCYVNFNSADAANVWPALTGESWQGM